MPVLYDGYNECQKCGKNFGWVHFEWLKSKISDNHFQVERLPVKPCAKEINFIDKNHKEYIVCCPNCGFNNHFIIEM